MGLFKTLFRSNGGRSTPTIKVRESNQDRSKVVADRYSHTGGKGHVHESYKLDRTSGSYSEYHSGENSSDRSYSKHG